MKKELYTEAELDVIRFVNDDVITESCTEHIGEACETDGEPVCMHG